jgi:DNA-binding LacI/PurR family transcriptional regulator
MTSLMTELLLRQVEGDEEVHERVCPTRLVVRESA